MKTASVSYPQLKSLISSKGLLLQYIENLDSYDLFALETNISWETSVLKDGGSDVIDFETNLKTSCNKPLEIRAAAGRPQRFSSSPQPIGTVEHWKGYQITVPAGQTSAYIDISFGSTVYLRGGYIVSSDVDFDDYVQADVLVAANSATYIGGLITTAYMIPNLPVSFESDESMAFPTSLKIRVTLNICEVEEQDVHANVLVDYFI